MDRDDFLLYLTYSEEDEKLGMVCTTAGACKTAPNSVYPPRKKDHPAIFRNVAEGRTLPEFQIVYITKGAGVLTVEDSKYALSAGSLFLLFPGIKHQYKPNYETGWNEYWVGFNGDYFNKLLREGILSPGNMYFEVGLQDKILSLFYQIFDEVISQQPLFQIRACVTVLALIAEMLTFARRRQQPNYYQKIVEKAKFLMASNVYNAINLPHISGEIGISTSRLNEIFKTYTAMTPYQYFIHIKILQAEGLLEQNDMSVKEVAFKLGFEDQHYFSRLFKSKTGISPSEWRNYLYQ
jgi:AraC-like DNA-binding protein